MIDIDIAHWKWKPSPFFSVKNWFRRLCFTEAFFSASTHSINLHVKGSDAHEIASIPTSIEALDDITVLCARARTALVQEAAKRLLAAIGTRRSITLEELKREIANDDWFDRVNGKLQEVLDCLTRDDLIETRWEEGEYKLPRLRVLRKPS